MFFSETKHINVKPQIRLKNEHKTILVGQKY